MLSETPLIMRIILKKGTFSLVFFTFCLLLCVCVGCLCVRLVVNGWLVVRSGLRVGVP